MRWLDPWRVRRAAVALCTVLIVAALLLFLGVQVGETHGGTAELINGRADTSALLLPLVLFLAGAGGLLALLGWRPSRDTRRASAQAGRAESVDDPPPADD